MYCTENGLGIKLALKADERTIKMVIVMSDELSRNESFTVEANDGTRTIEWIRHHDSDQLDRPPRIQIKTSTDAPYYGAGNQSKYLFERLGPQEVRYIGRRSYHKGNGWGTPKGDEPPQYIKDVLSDYLDETAPVWRERQTNRQDVTNDTTSD